MFISGLFSKIVIFSWNPKLTKIIDFENKLVSIEVDNNMKGIYIRQPSSGEFSNWWTRLFLLVDQSALLIIDGNLKIRKSQQKA